MFKGRHFDRSVILLCVRWYLAYNLSLRDLEEIATVTVDEEEFAGVEAGLVAFVVKFGDVLFPTQ